MARLGSAIVDALVLHEGPHGVLRRLAHPFWFQALGAVMGIEIWGHHTQIVPAQAWHRQLRMVSPDRRSRRGSAIPPDHPKEEIAHEARNHSSEPDAPDHL
jgi:hypothetical protein